MQNNFYTYYDAKKTVSALKVVNDSAERGIALASCFNSTLTKHEEQKQFLLQIVKGHQKQFQNPMEKILLS